MTDTTNQLLAVSVIRRQAVTGILRARRVAAGVGLREFAPAVGVSPSALSRLERGLVRPTPDHAVRWEAALRAIESSSSAPYEESL